MLKLTLFEFIFRGVPEAFILMFSLFTLSNTSLKMKRYIMSSLILAFGEYLIRMLPINYGVHTILGIFLMILLMCVINNTDIILSIKAALVTTIILYVLEGIDLFISSFFMKNNLQFVMTNSYSKVVVGIPALSIFLIILLFFNHKKRKGV